MQLQRSAIELPCLTALRPTSLVVLGVATALASISPAQDDSDSAGVLPQALDVTPLVDLRLRSVIDASRDLRAQPEPAARFPLRGAVGVQASALERFGARLALGAAGALGDRATEPALFVDEALVEARLPWGDSLTQVRIGRQAIEWLDGRLVGAESFADQPRRIDAVRLSLGLGALDFDSFATALDSQQRLADLDLTAARSAGDYLGGAAATWRLGTRLTLDGHALGHIANAVASQDDPLVPGDERRPLRVATVGASVRIEPAQLVQASSAFDLQVGEARGLEHQAFDVSSRLALIGPWPGRPMLQVGFDQASGAPHPSTNRSSAFDAPLSAIHNRFGAGDLLRPSNAQDIWVAARAAVDASWLALSLHRLALTSANDAWIDGTGRTMVAAGGGDKTLLGYELDIEGNLELTSSVSLELLYALFVPDGLARSEVGPRTSHRLLVGIAIAY